MGPVSSPFLGPTLSHAALQRPRDGACEGLSLVPGSEGNFDLLLVAPGPRCKSPVLQSRAGKQAWSPLPIEKSRSGRREAETHSRPRSPGLLVPSLALSASSSSMVNVTQLILSPLSPQRVLTSHISQCQASCRSLRTGPSSLCSQSQARAPLGSSTRVPKAIRRELDIFRDGAGMDGSGGDM